MYCRPIGFQHIYSNPPPSPPPPPPPTPREFPSHCKDTYMAPPLVSSDWLNEVWSVREDVEDDYKFIYMGPEGTW